MTDPTPLSPTAQAALCAAARRYAIDGDLQDSIAAALRAAADQAIPLTKTPWGTTLIPVLTSQESRDRLLAIATELENHAN